MIETRGEKGHYFKIKGTQTHNSLKQEAKL